MRMVAQKNLHILSQRLAALSCACARPFQRREGPTSKAQRRCPAPLGSAQEQLQQGGGRVAEATPKWARLRSFMAFRALQPAAGEPGAAPTPRAPGAGNPGEGADAAAGGAAEHQVGKGEGGGVATAADQSCRERGPESHAPRQDRDGAPDAAQKAGQGRVFVSALNE